MKNKYLDYRGIQVQFIFIKLDIDDLKFNVRNFVALS